MSSYVTSKTFSSETSTAFGFNVIIVDSVINTGPAFGTVETTINLNPAKPKVPTKNDSSDMLKTSSKNGESDITLLHCLTPPGTTISPLTTALPNNTLLNNSGSALTITPFCSG